MTDQFELFNLGEAHARWHDPDTSHEAAEYMREEGQAARLERLVADTLKRYPEGLTTHGIVDILHMEWNSISPRLRPLVRKGLVIDSGERRMGKMGRNCIVWKSV